LYSHRTILFKQNSEPFFSLHPIRVFFPCERERETERERKRKVHRLFPSCSFGHLGSSRVVVIF
jgi:hypothetical protein